jgi:hypothetical protein
MKIVASGTNVQVVLAAAYAYDGSSMRVRVTSAPIEIQNRFIVSIFPHKLQGGASLQLKINEQVELFQNFVEYSGLALSDGFGDYLFNICAGQVRALTMLLCILYMCIYCNLVCMQAASCCT